MRKEFEDLFRKASNILGLSTRNKIDAVKVGHQVDNLTASVFTATGAEECTLQGAIDGVQRMIDILDDPEVKEEWGKLYEEECAKPGNENGINAFQDWPLRRQAYDTVMKRRENS